MSQKWADVFSTLGQGASEVGQLFGRFNDQKVDQMNQDARMRFQERMAQLNREHDVSMQDRQDARSEKSQDRQDSRFEKSSKFQIEQAGLDRGLRERQVAVSEKGVDLQEGGRLRDDHRMGLQRFDRQLQSLSDDNNFLLLKPEQQKAQISRIELSRAAFDLQFRHENGMLNEKERAAIDRSLEQAKGDWLSVADAWQRRFGGSEQGGDETAPVASPQSSKDGMQEMVGKGRLSQEGENFRGQSGRLYDPMGDQIKQQPETVTEPIKSSTQTKLRIARQSLASGKKVPKTMAKELIESFTMEQLDGVQPGLFMQLAEISRGSSV